MESVDLVKLRRVIDVNKRIVDDFFAPNEGDLILVAGAGHGQEARLVHEAFRLRTIGVDINMDGRHFLSGSPDLVLQRQDLAAMAFRDSTFALIYCNHVLEHVGFHMPVLRELNRVLKPGGCLFVGFPNKNRLVAYISTSQSESLADRLKWNLSDWRLRCVGRFENGLGAHAGFTQKQFLKDANTLFGKVYAIRNRYMYLKHPAWGAMFKWIIRAQLEDIVFPSNYYVCIKDAPRNV